MLIMDFSKCVSDRQTDSHAMLLEMLSHLKIKLILGNDEAFPFLLKKEFIEVDEDFSDEEDEDVPVPSTSKVKLLKYIGIFKKLPSCRTWRWLDIQRNQ